MAGAVPLTAAALAGRVPVPAASAMASVPRPAVVSAAAACDDLVTAGTLLLARLASHSLVVKELVLRSVTRPMALSGGRRCLPAPAALAARLH